MAPPAARLSAAPPGACKCRAGPSSACGHASAPPFTCEEHRTFCLSPAARCPSRHMPASAMQPHFPPAAGCPFRHMSASAARPHFPPAVHPRRPAPPVRCAGRRSFPFPASARPAPWADNAACASSCICRTSALSACGGAFAPPCTLRISRTPISHPRCIRAVLRRLRGLPVIALFPFRRVLARRLGPPAPPCPAPCRLCGRRRGLSAEKLLQAAR